PPTTRKFTPTGSFPPTVLPQPEQSPVAARIESLIKSIQKADTAQSAPDPQMARLDAMLDKIMRIEHPQPSIPRDTLAKPGHTLSLVQPAQPDEGLATLQVGQIDKRDSDVSESADAGGLYSIDDPLPTDTLAANTISAIVHGDQVLTTGSTLELFLMDDAVISGKTIPREYPLYGKATLNGDRLLVSIHSIRSGPSVYPVSLEVYDLDGLPGIRIPGDLTRDVTKQSAGQGIDAIGLTTFDSSIGAQATQAGIQAAKTLMSRKVRLTRVTIPAGYQVLLKNTPTNH
ncbi:MAG: conjugative transposon protein TraM, partial [Bacteroidota bacterium]|nr:conjugative transposon protein TraM [Bacteroidota bacterium]